MTWQSKKPDIISHVIDLARRNNPVFGNGSEGTLVNTSVILLSDYTNFEAIILSFVSATITPNCQGYNLFL